MTVSRAYRKTRSKTVTWKRKRKFRSRRAAPSAKKGRSGFRDSYLTSTHGSSAGGWNYKNKRLNKRKFRRERQIASDAAQHHRSNNCIAGVYGSALATQQGRISFIPVIADTIPNPSFWQTTGGLVVADGDTAATDFGGGDLWIRGGKATITLSNPMTSANVMKYRTWRCRTTALGLPPSNLFVASQDWDPSLPDVALATYDAWRYYKFFDNVDYITQPGETVERSIVLLPRKIDQTGHQASQNRDFWIVQTQNLTAGTNQNTNVLISHNLTFTGDRVI